MRNNLKDHGLREKEKYKRWPENERLTVSERITTVCQNYILIVKAEGLRFYYLFQVIIRKKLQILKN